MLRSKGEGDSTFSVFVRASDALRAAYQLQRAMRSERWPADAIIRTRVGVDTGEAIERGGDYYGTTVNRVARLRGSAQGGNIFVGATTATITRQVLPEGTTTEVLTKHPGGDWYSRADVDAASETARQVAE